MYPHACATLRRYPLCLQIPFQVGGLNCVHYRRSNYGTDYKFRSRHKYLQQTVFILGAAVGTWGLFYYNRVGRNQQVLADCQSNANLKTVGIFKHELPVYSLEEVSQHSTKEQRIWVTFDQGVYDITEFVDEHPGGERIMMAAGGSVEPFWMLYAVHKDPAILNMLEGFRIGNLSKEEALESTANMEDPYADDPRRHPALRPSSRKPFNAEPPPVLLVDSFITPRNHLPVPDVDPKTYELEISGVGIKSLTLTLDDLKKKFPPYTITAAIQCAGNRRSEMVEVKAVKGLNWGPSAIGNATWTGARLYDVLSAAGLKEGQPGVEHIQFEGLDVDAANVSYGASIPIEKAMNPRGDVLLVYEMNGKPLSRDHGYPVRVVVPGVVGARNVKWLGRIVVAGKESSSHWQQNDYKGFSPSVDWDNVDFSSSPAIQELPVISAICDPVQGSRVELLDGKLVVRGYAWSGGGQKIIRIDVTADGGNTWYVAKIKEQDSKSKVPRHWGWTLWQAEIPISPGTHKVELWAKAVDSSYNIQPERFEHIWNLRGVLSNAYHRVKVNIA